MAKTIRRGSRGTGRRARGSKTVTAYGRRYKADPTNQNNSNLPIPGEWLVDTRVKKELPKLDICKIRPERLRNMTLQQLERVQFFIGEPTMAERLSKTNPRGLLNSLARNLAEQKRVEAKGPDAYEYSKEATDTYRRKYPNTKPPLTYQEVLDLYRSEANRDEMKIFDAQQKKKCPIAERDVVARDYIRSGGQDLFTINKIRGKRRPKIR